MCKRELYKTHIAYGSVVYWCWKHMTRRKAHHTEACSNRLSAVCLVSMFTPHAIMHCSSRRSLVHSEEWPKLWTLQQWLFQPKEYKWAQKSNTAWFNSYLPINYSNSKWRWVPFCEADKQLVKTLSAFYESQNLVN